MGGEEYPSENRGSERVTISLYYANLGIRGRPTTEPDGNFNVRDLPDGTASRFSFHSIDRASG